MKEGGHMKYTLITGASGGLGRSFARECASHGQNLILVTRTGSKLHGLKEKLEKTYGVDVEIYSADLSVKKERQKLFDYTTSNHMIVENLINNAGFGNADAYLDTPWELHKNMVDINVVALMHLSHLYGNEMKKRRKGRILNVASVAAFSAGSYMSVYYASKAFVFSLSQAMYEELKGYGVSVTALCPGPTGTNFENTAGLTNSKMFKVFGVEKADSVVKRGYKGMMRGKAIVYHSKVTYGFNIITRLVSRKCARNIAGRIN